MSYLHVEIESNQLARKAGSLCGDVFDFHRDSTGTTLVVSDGLGHGVKANISAGLCVSRFLELIRQGNSFRKSFISVAKTMHEVRGTDMPYAVITAVRILNDGVATVLSYEMPQPILLTSRYAQILNHRIVVEDGVMISESNCHLNSGEGIVVVTDGVTQSGMGEGFIHGWTIEGVEQYVSGCLADRVPVRSLPDCIVDKARRHWPKGLGDDITAVMALCRPGRTVNLLTGPPADQSKDCETVSRFMRMDGVKVVSGGSTAKIVSRCLNSVMTMEQDPQSMLAPPRYFIEGIDLVTEGAVTLNQVYNVLDEDYERFDEESGVTLLHELLNEADRVNIIMGSAHNPATEDISFRQKGILTRQVIVPLLADKLRESGKLVVVEKA